MEKWEKPQITILGLDKTKGSDLPTIPTSDVINEDLLGESYKNPHKPQTSGCGGSSSSSSSSHGNGNGNGHCSKPKI